MRLKMNEPLQFSSIMIKKSLQNIFLKLTFVFLLFMLLAGSCNKEPSVSGVTLTSDSLALTLHIDETANLYATVFPKNATCKIVKWSSSDTNVVVVNRGRVMAKQEGSALITVTTAIGGFNAVCTVVVTTPHPAEPVLIKVEGGTFAMGCSDGDCYKDGSELPVHVVTVSSFKIAQYPITQKQWATIMGNSYCYFHGDNLPVDYVSWNAALEFIQKLNKITGKNYRLPTEAEWEFAARGGNKSKGYKYSGSNSIDRVAWYNENSKKTTHPIGTKKSNELGIFDMSGNVWECCSDWYGVYSEEPQINPVGTSQGEERVARGGSCFSGTIDPRVSSRVKCAPNIPYLGMGLRLVLPN